MKILSKIKKIHPAWALFFLCAIPFMLIGFACAFGYACTLAGFKMYNRFIDDVMPD